MWKYMHIVLVDQPEQNTCGQSKQKLSLIKFRISPVITFTSNEIIIFAALPSISTQCWVPPNCTVHA